MAESRSPLSDPTAAITHAAVRAALPAAAWGLYGRTRAGLGGLETAYVWQGDAGGWALAIAQAGRRIGAILLTTAPLTGVGDVAVADMARVSAAPELLP